MSSVEKFNNLKQRMESLKASKTKIDTIKGERKTELLTLLKSVGCNNKSELEAKVTDLKQKSDTLEQDVLSYLEENEPKIKQIEDQLVSSE